MDKHDDDIYRASMASHDKIYRPMVSFRLSTIHFPQRQLEGDQRVHMSAKWISLQLLYRVGREMVPR